VPLKYNLAESFSAGSGLVMKGDYIEKDWGFVDKLGKEVIPLHYADAANFSDGLAMVRALNGGWVLSLQMGKHHLAWIMIWLCRI
jgi:hypothetical protein